MVLGSVSRYAATQAACPVVVVREETMAAHRQVVVGIRDTGDCDAALTFAFEEAAMRNASLLAVHTWQSPEPLLHSAEAETTVVLTELLAAWRAKYPDVIVDQDVVQGHPGRVLAGYSARADLVVLGRHGEHGVARVAHAVLGHAHGPVATVPSALPERRHGRLAEDARGVHHGGRRCDSCQRRGQRRSRGRPGTGPRDGDRDGVTGSARCSGQVSP
jgi:nucleotide-binding universal stress UspA family protein